MKKKLKCIKCTTDNVRSASFCKNCGNQFTEEEKEAVKKGSIVWILEKFDKIKSFWDLSFITDNIIFKVGSVLVVLGIGIYFYFTNGINLKLQESEDYRIQYNEKMNEYYLLTEKNQTELSLYIPNRAKEVVIQHMDSANQELEKVEYKQGDKIVLDSNGENDYYMIEAEYGNNKDQIKLYVYREVKE